MSTIRHQHGNRETDPRMVILLARKNQHAIGVPGRSFKFNTNRRRVKPRSLRDFWNRLEVIPADADALKVRVLWIIAALGTAISWVIAAHHFPR
jgi:hypothetical protein